MFNFKFKLSVSITSGNVQIFVLKVAFTIWVSKGRREIAADDGQAWQAEILHIIRSEISRVTLGKVWVLC